MTALNALAEAEHAYLAEARGCATANVAADELALDWLRIRGRFIATAALSFPKPIRKQIARRLVESIDDLVTPADWAVIEAACMMGAGK